MISKDAALAAAYDSARAREATVNAKQFIVATVVTFLILLVAGFLIHGKLLANTYRMLHEQGTSFRTEEALQHKLWIVWISDLLYSMLFVWIYMRGQENKPWAGQGIRFGIVMGLFTIVCPVLNQYVAYNIPHTLAVHWMLLGMSTILLAGIVVARICKPSGA
jgi:uncharacterized BrkB/YihY/UPF0761 family membrane protein